LDQDQGDQAMTDHEPFADRRLRYFLNICRIAKKHRGHLWQPRLEPLGIISEMVARGFLTREEVFAGRYSSGAYYIPMQRYALTGFGASHLRGRS
jgi:hypothetical protein